VGDAWYTWRGSCRHFAAGVGRRVFNATLNGQVVGSALVHLREADDEMDGADLFDFVDNDMAYVWGPYFHDPDGFEETAYLHFESMYVLEDRRRSGIAHALIDAVAGVGLPTYCQFATDFLPPIFERWSAHEEDGWQATMDTPGGSLESELALASDGLEPESSLSGGSLSAEIELTLYASHVDWRLRGVDSPEGQIKSGVPRRMPEGTPELDRRDHESSPTWDGEAPDYLPGLTVAELEFQLSEARSGTSAELELVDLSEVRVGSDEPVRLRLSAAIEVERPALLTLRAAWRHFLATYDADWRPVTQEDALRAILRGPRHHIERVELH
jgi:GNAT superfamily N-acetyltransferase